MCLPVGVAIVERLPRAQIVTGWWALYGFASYKIEMPTEQELAEHAHTGGASTWPNNRSRTIMALNTKHDH